MMVEAGQYVKVLSAKGNHVVVRPLDPDELPPDIERENDDA